MAIFRQKSNNDWRHKRSQEQLALGGLPLNAEWRLRQLRDNKRLFTSEFNVSELAMLSLLHIRPVGQVMGTSVYHVGWIGPPITLSMELRAISEAHNHATRLALTRLQMEAQSLGARGVFGITLDIRPFGGADAMLEVTATGTAVTWPATGSPPAVPLLCGLGGQDTSALYAAGYFPAGLAYGTCVYYQIGTNATLWATQKGLWSGSARQNQELSDYTHGFREARRAAVQRMEYEAEYLRANGIVGVSIAKKLRPREVEVEINEKKQQRRDLIVEFSIVGTAIQAVADVDPQVYPVMPLG